MSLLVALAAGFLLRSAPSVGDSVEAFTIRGPENRAFTWRPGRVSVICFCAFWCDTWKDQLPRVGEVHKQLQGLPVDFFTVSVDGRWSERGQRAAVGTNLSDPGGKWSTGVGIDRVPYTLLIDKQGIIRWSAYGVLRSQELARAARQALNNRVTGGKVYLTFDDFPAERGNDELLDVLRAQHVPATFFCICAKLGRYAVVAHRAVKEGHSLQIHAWDHDEKATDIGRCRKALSPFGGGELFRPSGSEKVLASGTSMPLPLPVVDPYDFKRPGTTELVRRVTNGVRPNAVIQLHAGVQETLEALPAVIKNLRQRGYTFELLTN